MKFVCLVFAFLLGWVDGMGRELRTEEMSWIAQADVETKDLGSSIWQSHPSGSSCHLFCFVMRVH